MMEITNAPFIRELGEMTDNMSRLGWNERNGGNISILLRNEEIEPYLPLTVIRDLPLAVAFPEFAGRYFIVTGTGKYFKNISKDPERNLGLIRISDNGSSAHLLWGYSDGGSFTSEIIMHLGAHGKRLAHDPNQRVVMHAHPTSTICMTHMHSWDEKEFTKTLWQMCTECIVIFPEGVGVLPWMVSSNAAIGLASADKFDEFRILIWALHGCTATGASLDEAFGLMETVEKGAEIYVNIAGRRLSDGIDDTMLRQVAEAFRLEVREGWL
ncbi:MAG: rhamnulose-1-phosphate aldolase [Eubacteriales bacterium]